MRAGVALPQYGIDVDAGSAVWPAMMRQAAAADRLGLDSVWLSDHPFAIGPDGVAWGAVEPLTAAAALVRATSRVRVGTLVLSAAMRHASITASAVRTILEGAPGRFVVGIGCGWYEPEHRAFGIPRGSYADRVAALAHTVGAVRASAPSVGVLVGGSGGALLDVAARGADVWNVSWDASPATFDALGARLDEACARAGRDPGTIARTVGVNVLVGENDRAIEAAIGRVRERAPFLRTLDRADLERAIVCGTPDACAERLAAYRADHVIVALFVRDDAEMLQLFAERVAPLLRAG